MCVCLCYFLFSVRGFLLSERKGGLRRRKTGRIALRRTVVAEGGVKKCN